MKRILVLITAMVLTLATYADVLAEYSFDGTLGDNIPFSVKFCVNGDEIAIGEIYYPKAKHPAPILLVGSMTETGYYMREYQSDGTVTGTLIFSIDDDEDGKEPHLASGVWINPRTQKEFKLKNVNFNDEYIDVPYFLDYEDPQNIGREYSYSVWNSSYKAMMGGNVKFRGAGKNKLHFEVSNCAHNIAEGKSAPDRPAVLGEYTRNYFVYENVNECGYGFSAYFFKKFVVLKSTTDYSTFGCFGMGATFDGVYIKVKQ